MLIVNKDVYKDIEEIIYKKKLNNGLTVLLLPKEEMSKTYSLFTTKYGSIDQTFIPFNQDEKVTVPDGIAHFLEHKLFEKEDRDVFSDFGKLGAAANAYTSFTKTAYLFSATANIEKNVEILLDFVQDPYFSEQSVEKEKGIITQEIKMYNDQPDWQSFMGIIKSMFKDHPVKSDIAGTVDSIQKITKDDLYMCYETFYHPENMTLFIAGNFNVDSMMELIENNQTKKTFPTLGEIKRFFPDEQKEVAIKEQTVVMPVSIPKVSIGIKESNKKMDPNVHLKKDLFQSMFLDYYFSTGGPFYQTLYEENLIDDSFEFSTSLEESFGYSMIASNTQDPILLSNRVKELLLSTREAAFSKERFDMIKKKKIGQMLRSMNSLEFIANQYTHYDMLGIDFFQLIPTIQSLTLDEANNFIKNWIDKQRLAVFTILPEQEV